MRVRWKSDGKTMASRLENVGLGGLYLHAANPAHEGTMIDVVLDLPTGQVYARAKVRRSTPAKGMGLQFIQMTPEDRAKLNRYLAAPEVSAKAPAAASPAARFTTAKCIIRKFQADDFASKGGTGPASIRAGGEATFRRDRHGLPTISF